MKSSKAEISATFHKIPTLHFADKQQLTSYSGLVLIQALLATVGLKKRFLQSVAMKGKKASYKLPSLLMLVLVLLLLGFRRLRDLDFCRDDPMIRRVVGLQKLPSVATLSRNLAKCDDEVINKLRQNVLREPVLERLEAEKFARLTVDFDGSVQSTRGHAEGTAVGYNPVKPGARSYYPLFCTIAQVDQFFDMHHRPGNVHDSNGASDFMGACFWQLGRHLPGVKLETRIDSAFFNELVFLTMEEHDVEFSCSVPFERFPALKRLIEECTQWDHLDETWSSFETTWKPQRWDESYRVILVRQRKPVRHREPIQLDLFIPRDFEFEYSVIATNKKTSAGNVVRFHHGRGSQEKLIGEAKQHAALDVIAGKRLTTNRTFSILGMLAHNLSRELQMAARPSERPTLPSRMARWVFQSLGTLRQLYFHRAGKLSHPQGNLTLTMNPNDKLEADFGHYLEALST